ncbi:MAG: pilus assembly protein TadE [Mycolicibacterium sp.]|nr:pilus assembly protein TadE [Mycolicibacterium sp.]
MRCTGADPRARSWWCVATADSSSRGSVRGRSPCWASRLRPRRWRRWNPGSERGSASVVAAAIMAVMMALTVGGAVVGAAVIARHRAQAAADLAALSAAWHLVSGPAAACASAASLAAAMSASMATCTVADLDVVVTVEVPVGLGRWGVHVARAVARAGPA